MQTMLDGIPFYQNSLLSTAVFSAILFGAYYLITAQQENASLHQQ
jgi:predicted secreted protein